MALHRLFGCCLLCLLIVACDKQEEGRPVDKQTSEKQSSEKQAATVKTQAVAPPNEKQVVPEQTKPALDLSIDSIMDDYQKNQNDIFLDRQQQAEDHDTLFNTPGRKSSDSSISVSGKLLTDDTDDIDDYKSDLLKSVDGVQINIQGNFE